MSFGDNSLITNEGERSVQYITEKDILRYYPKNFSQHIDKALLNISKVFPGFDCSISLQFSGGSVADLNKKLPFVEKVRRLTFVDCEIHDYKDTIKVTSFLDLMVDMGYFKKNVLSGINDYSITSKGWLHIQELQATITDSKQAFVAMWFDSTTDNAWSKISRAIRDCGYIPIRIDKKEHNNQIVPEIFYEINIIKFIIADLTGNRNGVYYEEGYAQALNKEVIVTWKKTDEKEEQPHFDIAQKNMIRWENENDLYNCLVKRIEATVGKLL